MMMRFFSTLLLVMSVPTLILTQSEFNVNVVKQKRSTANLEYVMKILEEQGRLHEVDGELLKASHENKGVSLKVDCLCKVNT